MTTSAIKSALPIEFNRTAFTLYLAGMLVLFVFALGYMLYKGKYLYLALILASPLLILVLTQPKLVISQYIFFLFISRTVIETIPLTITDISAILVVLAGSIDFFLNGQTSEKLPRMSLNYVILILALSFSGVFAYEHDLALRAVLRVAFHFCVFLSLYRLFKSTGVEYALKFFYWVCVINSIAVTAAFFIYGGLIRSFGLAPKFFDDLSMLTFPLGLALYFWAPRGKGGKYLSSSIIVLGALVATQSRAPLLMSISVAVLVFLFSIRRFLKIKRTAARETEPLGSRQLTSIFKKGMLVTTILVGATATVLVLAPTLFETVRDRFADILSTATSGTIGKRFLLWQNAFLAFLDHPLVGVGPGNYKVIHTIYPSVHLEFIHFYVRGLNAHNLILHYLAESGLIGAIPMLALVINQFRLSQKGWKVATGLQNTQVSAGLYAVGMAILITSIVEADWMWGFAGYTFVFSVALTTRNFHSKR